MTAESCREGRREEGREGGREGERGLQFKNHTARDGKPSFPPPSPPTLCPSPLSSLTCCVDNFSLSGDTSSLNMFKAEVLRASCGRPEEEEEEEAVKGAIPSRVESSRRTSTEGGEGGRGGGRKGGIE